MNENIFWVIVWFIVGMVACTLITGITIGTMSSQKENVESQKACLDKGYTFSFDSNSNVVCNK